jgi:phosphoribosyl 1,2-cyclic phosphate phosphodiesterase
MKIRMLGTGTSHGIPIVGCSCKTCTSDNPKNTRYRTSVQIQENDKTVIIDTPAEFRIRTIDYNIKEVHAVLLTHSHADHTAGLDDVRRYNEMLSAPMPLFADGQTLGDIKKRFDYIFKQTQEGGGKPRLELIKLEGGRSFSAAGIEFTAIKVKHGNIHILGFRTGGFAFLTDVSAIPDESFELLKGLDILVLDALRIEKHPTHFNLEQAIEAAKKIGAKRTYFTHITHSLEYEETNKSLPDGMELAYDGLEFEL